MRSPQLADDAVQVVLLSRCRNAALAAGPVAKHFGLTLGKAEALLERGRGVIASHISMACVRKVLPLFAALGVQVAIRPKDAEPEMETYDLSLRSMAQKPACAALQVLKDLGFDRLGPPSDFAGPSGLVLGDLNERRVKAVEAALRSVSGVQITVCAKSDALYDLFASEKEPGVNLAAVRHHLAVMGSLASGSALALATGLNQQTLAHVLARFPQQGLFGVNQLFQRYDLELVGQGQLSTQELRDFLATRGISSGQASLAIESGCGLRVEYGLSRAAARQFLLDYAAIGLPVRAELVRT
ncbi:MAG: hypothetical protein ACOH2H_21635 [Cypionkella sp.]